jgi:surfactin synthase thioesterase subunit
VNLDLGLRDDGENAFVRVLRRVPPTPNLVRLICFPYAGGSPHLFQAWLELLADNVELVAVELPGHAARVKEAPYDRWDLLVADTLNALLPILAEPHAFFGHSFGGRLAFEIALRAPGDASLTKGFFVAACRSPGRPQRRPYLHQLSDAELIAAVRSMGGTPGGVLENAGLMGVFLPVIRAEIRLAELWSCGRGRRMLTAITALYGELDQVETYTSMCDWPGYSRAGGEVIQIPGGHFFLQTHRRDVVRVINDRLNAI